MDVGYRSMEKAVVTHGPVWPKLHCDDRGGVVRWRHCVGDMCGAV
ncbi:hypothetical protein RSAG8_07033, partial [Rhizoctonia solani AG-8 WAC10335]